MPLPIKPPPLRLFLLLLMVGIELLLGALGSWLNPSLQYARSAILHGEVWRVFTGHLVHLGLVHTLLNMSGLVLIVHLFGCLLPVRVWVCCGLLMALGISVGFLLFNPELSYYAGMSGVLHGLLLFGIGLALLRNVLYPRWLLVLIGCGVVAKLFSEQLPSYDIYYLQEHMHAAVIVDAHLYGAIVGLSLLPLIHWWRTRRGRKS